MTDDTQTPGGAPREADPGVATGDAGEWSTVASPQSRAAQSLEPLPTPQNLPPVAPPVSTPPPAAPQSDAHAGYQPVHGTQPQPGSYAGSPGAGCVGADNPPPAPGYGSGSQYPPPPPLPVAGLGLGSNTAAAISYITFIPAVVFLVIEPYNRDRFVRYHAWQSVAIWVVIAALHLLFQLLAHIGLHLLWWFIHSAILLALFVFWLIALIKASQGQWYRIPVIGDLATSFASQQP